MIKKDSELINYFREQGYDADAVEIKHVGNKLEVTPLTDEPIHISEMRFENESWTGSTFYIDYTRKELSGAEYTAQIASGNLYLGQSKIVTFEHLSPDATGTLCRTNEKGIRVQSAFNSSTCEERYILDPNANCRAKYRATGTEFKITLHFDGTEVVNPPVPAGEGDLKIVNACSVSTEKGLLQQVMIKENGNNYRKRKK